MASFESYTRQLRDSLQLMEVNLLRVMLTMKEAREAQVTLGASATALGRLDSTQDHANDASTQMCGVFFEYVRESTLVQDEFVAQFSKAEESLEQLRHLLRLVASAEETMANRTTRVRIRIF
jgi:hypothetical protein